MAAPWADSYLASCGGAAREVIKRYVENQPKAQPIALSSGS
jgi:REP element-mobilizing transposase RayT